MLKTIRFHIQKLLSSKFIIKGKCKKCGQCCRNIVFFIGDSTIKTEPQFESLKKFNKSYNHFFISGVDDDKSLLFTCKSLSDDNTCRDYLFRSINCRNYPKINKTFIVNGGKSLDGCGFYFDVDKNFSKYIDF